MNLGKNLNKRLIFVMALSVIWFVGTQTASAYTSVTNDITTNTTWQTGQVYVIENSIAIDNGVQLTVQPGTIVKFQLNTALTVNGELSANATTASRSYFTSNRDDSIGGDTSPGDANAPAAGNWYQIQINDGASVSFDYSTIRFGGNGFNIYSNLYMVDGTLNLSNSVVASSTFDIRVASGSATVNNTEIKDASNYGIRVTGAGTFTINNSQFVDTTTAGYVDLDDGKIFNSSSNSFSGTGQMGFMMQGAVQGNQSWGTGVPHVITANTVTVNSGKTLTIDPGAVLKFENTAAILTVAGTLRSNGTSGSRIYFTSFKDDTVGGDTNNNGSSNSPAAGDWAHVRLNTGASVSIDYSTIRFGGGNITSNANLYITNGTLNITNSITASASGHGIRAASGSLNVLNNTLQDNGSYGLYANGPGSLTLSSNTFKDNSTASTYLDAEDGKVITLSGNTSEGGSQQGVVFDGITINANQTWGSGVYVIGSSGLTVGSGKTLTINPGAVVKFNGAASSLVVNGNLTASGSFSNPVYFTSVEDDLADGRDTNGDGASTGDPADWAYLRFNSGSTGYLRSALVLFGGSSSGSGNSSNVFVNGGDLDVELSGIGSSSQGFRIAAGSADISKSMMWGHNDKSMYIYSTGTITVTDSAVFGSSTSFGIENITGSNVSADYNYWGNSNGPYNSSSNPSGDGTRVSSDVTFSNWRGDWHCYIFTYVGHCIFPPGTDSVNAQNEIKWAGTTSYTAAWNYATSSWDGLNSVNIIASSSGKTLEISDIDDGSKSWIANYTFGAPGTIEFNIAHMPSGLTEQKNVTTHELGHALGLGHSYQNNIMFPYNTSQISFGSQDLSDYYYLWP